MGTFTLIIREGQTYVSMQIDKIHADNTEVLGESVRCLISELAKRNEVSKPTYRTENDISHRWYKE